VNVQQVSCCECDIDMTERVREACAVEEDRPFESPLEAIEAKSIDLVCDNGHVCTYRCPAESGATRDVARRELRLQ
jgi:hypothetical protein